MLKNTATGIRRLEVLTISTKLHAYSIYSRTPTNNKVGGILRHPRRVLNGLEAQHRNPCAQ